MSESTVSVGSRRLKLSNLDKVLYPEPGFTKAEVIDYYARIADVMVRHTNGRCVTLRRWLGVRASHAAQTRESARSRFSNPSGSRAGSFRSKE